MNKIEPRLHIEFAAGSSKAGILRRGPSEWTRLLLWDTVTDDVEAGAWFHGRIYKDCCSISPDGRLFSYLAAKHNGNQGGEDACGSWTAISRPPWLTAIAFWPQHGSQGLSTDFIDNNTLMISHPHWDELSPKYEIPNGFSVISKYTSLDAPEQSLPSPVKSAARFHNNNGVDQQCRSFRYAEGKLFRGDSLIVDLGAMIPNPEPSPMWARTWTDDALK